GGGAPPEQRLTGDSEPAAVAGRTEWDALRINPANCHVTVTPLTPPRPDLEFGVGVGYSDELQLLPVPLGKGVFGYVLLGTYRGHKVAVKLIGGLGGGPDGPSTAALARTMAQEVEVLGRCDHPNVVRLLAACLTPPRQCLVMELMETSLDRVLYGEPGALLPLGKVLAIAIGIASGLEYLHPFTVHRDLKPANVLINDSASDRPLAKITDFGLSRLRMATVETNTPEAGTDLFSFGVLLAEMLAGRPPWPGLNVIGIAHNVVVENRRPPLLEGLAEERCPGILRRMIEQCWETDAQRRPAAAELVKTLRMVQQMTGATQAPGSGAPE
ncbi:Mitogen-activated protein kinase kinase kinase 10, partial [Tetrabaena socialis]